MNSNHSIDVEADQQFVAAIDAAYPKPPIDYAFDFHQRASEGRIAFTAGWLAAKRSIQADRRIPVSGEVAEGEAPADPFVDDPRYKQYCGYMERLLPATMIYSGEEVLAKMATVAQGIGHAKLAEVGQTFEAWFTAEVASGRLYDADKAVALYGWQARGQKAGGAEE